MPDVVRSHLSNPPAVTCGPLSRVPGSDRLRPRLLTVAAVGAACALALLAGCGGSDDDVPVAPTPPAAVDTACQTTTSAGAAVVVGSGVPGDPALPEASSGFRLGMKPVQSGSYMVVTANPLASQAGCEVLKAGGSAADAAVAVQMVLGLVEPQSSGLGGGAFLLHYDAASKTLTSYDGRETAPAGATENYLRWISDTQQTTPLPNARASGRSIGTPGAVRMLEALHTRPRQEDLGQPTSTPGINAGHQRLCHQRPPGRCHRGATGPTCCVTPTRWPTS